jgi:ABC-2 type transport system ATP-binding protein
MHALQLNNLTKTYSNGTQALKGINLNIEQGDFFGLLGANGAGKSTIIGIISGLVNKTSGTVKVFGTDIDQDQFLARTHIGLVPQEFNFNIFESPITTLISQAGMYGIKKEIAIERAEIILKELGLWDKKDEQSRTLSGGMKRRLMIARALIHNPRLLILDEPTAGVDVELRNGMWEYLAKINQTGTTIVLTTHYLEEIEALCSNLAIMKGGVINLQGGVKELLSGLDGNEYLFEVKEINSDQFSKLKFSSEYSIENNQITLNITKDYELNKAISEVQSQNLHILAIKPKINRIEKLYLDVTN